MGTAGGIYHFRDQIRAGNPDAFFVMNGDVCADFPLKVGDIYLFTFQSAFQHALILKNIHLYMHSFIMYSSFSFISSFIYLFILLCIHPVIHSFTIHLEFDMWIVGRP